MTRRAVRRLITVAVALIIVVIALPPVRVAHAADPTPDASAVDRARAHYDRGLELFNTGEHRLALIELLRAYEIAPTYRLLYFIGQAQIRVGALASALPTLTRYLEEGAADIPAARREEVERDIVALRARTAHITITCNVDGAMVTVNGEEVGATPLAPRLLVEAGSTRVSASKAGYATTSRVHALAGADDAVIALDLTPTPTAPTAPAPPPTVATPQKQDATTSSSTAIIIGWSLAGAAVAGTVVSGAFAVAAVERVDTTRTQPITASVDQSQADLEHQRRVARGWLLATDIFGATALVAGGISIYLTLSSSRSRQPTVAIAPRPLGVDLRVVF